MKERWKEPDRFQWGTFQNDDGASVRYGHISPDEKTESKGTVVLLPGFRESIEKYFETAQDFTDRGYSVWLMDWRGQGGSERYLDKAPQKAHSEGYDAQVRDLDHFVKNVVEVEDEKPLLMAAHSMGGHLGLRYLKEHAGHFDGAMMTAPMLDIKTGALPKHIARTLAKHAVNGKKGDKYIPGGSDWSRSEFKGNKLTGDEERFEMFQDILDNNEDLQIGDATYRWVHEAFQSIDKLTDEDYIRAIDTEILMATPGQDDVVDVGAQDRAAKQLPRCTQIPFPNSRHELWMETDDMRDEWLKHCDDFLQKFENKKKLARDFDQNSRKHEDWDGKHPPTPHAPKPKTIDNDTLPQNKKFGR